MAYLSFSPRPAENGVGSSAAATPDHVSLFSVLELRVIELAERIDTTREISPDSHLGRLLERFLGAKLLRPLADPRLESLRRFVSLTAHHFKDVTEADVQHLVKAGYSPSQAYGLLGYFSGRAGRIGTSRPA